MIAVFSGCSAFVQAYFPDIDSSYEDAAFIRDDDVNYFPEVEAKPNYSIADGIQIGLAVIDYPAERYNGADGNTTGEDGTSSLPAAISPERGDSNENEFHQTARPTQSKRQMIYSAKFAIATATVNETIEQFIAGVNSIGGYLESRDDNRVVVRVPADSFDRVVDNTPSLGEVLSRSIKNEDVTRKYRNLRLRIESLAAAHQRILELLKTADKLDDIIKLEEQLRTLTLQLETAQGEFKSLSEQVAFSRVEIDFREKTSESAAQRTKKVSSFAWINQMGVKQIADEFEYLDQTDVSARRTLKTMWPGAVNMQLPDGFVVVQRKRNVLKAVTASDVRLSIRKLAVSQNGDIGFWADALTNHLVAHRGYELIVERTVRDARGREGRELTFDVVVGGEPTRYLATLFVDRRPFWSRNNAIQVTEFVAPKEEFQRQVDKLHESKAWRVVESRKSSKRELVGHAGRLSRMSARGQSPGE
jgi:hypothetical protein